MTDAIQLSVFSSRLNAICEEMGAALRRAAFSPNIKDRLDYSCAVFDAEGKICAQAAHIPVHLGSMAYAMADIVNALTWGPDDVVVVNDPYKGGTHLPDVTVIAPLFFDGQLTAFAVNRAHHANIGSDSPGSMPIASKLEQEGIIIPPSYLIKGGQRQDALYSKLLQGTHAQGDFLAQISSCKLGVKRLAELLTSLSRDEFIDRVGRLNHYGESLALQFWQKIPDGVYQFTDYMDSDGMGQADIPIYLVLTVERGFITADFSGSAEQVKGNINCPIAVAAAAVFYCLRCLLPDYAPSCAGIFAPIKIVAPLGCLLNAQYPAAVAAGNVETSSRVVDVVFGALAKALPEVIPAASQGTMNNLAMGSNQASEGHAAQWDYYETIAGGGGASAAGAGMSARHSHMTNTLNTPVESIEAHYPVTVKAYRVRRGSGGAGQNPGGDGVLKEYQFNAPAQVTLLTERRQRGPWGNDESATGKPGANALNGVSLPAKASIEVQAGDVLTIETPGGGGWNSPL